MRGLEAMKSMLPDYVKDVIRPFYSRIKKTPKDVDVDPRWTAVQQKLSESRRVIDLGCGNYPVRGAAVGVDFFIEPKERGLGSAPPIDTDALKERGIIFINTRIDEPLPFRNKEFDFAYSHHVFEHLEDPATACGEMMRIAKSGVIITPSILAELIFGRSYHRWLIMERGNTIFFFRKRPFEDRPFGEHPKLDKGKGKWIVEKNTNPFDILLNENRWYRGKEKLPRLSNKIRKYWHSHSPIMEVIFIWEGGFDYKVYQ